MRRSILLALMLAFCAPAFADGGPVKNKRVATSLLTCLDDVALNGAASTRTFVWPCVAESRYADALGYDTLVLHLYFTHGNNGALTLTCTHQDGSDDDPETADQITPTVCTGSGSCTLTDSGTFTSASLSADWDRTIRLDVAGLKNGQCVIAHGGSPDASDKITIKGRLVTEGGGQ